MKAQKLLPRETKSQVSTVGNQDTCFVAACCQLDISNICVCAVHYTGTLVSDGTKFDSSVDRSEPFKFKLGTGMMRERMGCSTPGDNGTGCDCVAGAVIKGWDAGVATMTKGEKAILTCQAHFAYGSAGSPPTIPPDAALNFEVELLSWKSESDLTSDGGVVKAVLAEGSGWAHPGDLDEATGAFLLLTCCMHMR